MAQISSTCIEPPTLPNPYQCRCERGSIPGPLSESPVLIPVDNARIGASSFRITQQSQLVPARSAIHTSIYTHTYTHHFSFTLIHKYTNTHTSKLTYIHSLPSHVFMQPPSCTFPFSSSYTLSPTYMHTNTFSLTEPDTHYHSHSHACSFLTHTHALSLFFTYTV